MKNPGCAPGHPKGAYAVVSLGCPKNLVDTERMAGLLRRDGYELVGEPEGADFVVVNTCAFLADAREESYGVIREMLRLKERGLLRGVIVAGCLAEREKSDLLNEFPAVDKLVGVFARDEIAAAAKGLFSPERSDQTHFHPAPTRPLPDDGRLRLTLPHVAYLKVAEGCNRQCSFCSIPSMRGRLASKPIEQVVAEAEELAGDGARELILVAQDTSSYGLDVYGRPRLAELLVRLDAVDALAWIRLMYLYPTNIDDELLDAVASAGKVLPYVDLPLQHVNDEVLRRMRRGITRQRTLRLLERLRERIGRLVLRTTLIAGFPGETQQQFEELLAFVRERHFQRLGAFAYCEEPGTLSAGLDGQLAEDVKQSRRRELLAAQQEIAFAFGRAQVGRRTDVMIDRDMPGEKDAYVGRSYADAPDVDGLVYVTGTNLEPGSIVSSEIVASRGYDLIAVSN